MDFLRNIWNWIPSWLKNKYFLLIFSFLLILLFFDSNNAFRLFKRKQALRELTQEEQFYKEQLEEIKTEKEALENDPEALEKFAREEYRMKKDDEDVFVIVNEDKELQ